MKSLFVELVEDVLIPVVILSGILVVAFVFYVALGYLLVVKMLLRELFLSLESHPETQAETVETIEIKDEEMKLSTPEQVKEYVKPIKVAELRKMAQSAGIKGARNMRKADLLEAMEIKS